MSDEPHVSQINPFTGSVLQAPHVQRTQATDRDRQLRRVNDLSKNAALQGEQHQHEVESSEAVTPAHDDQPRNPRQGKKSPPPHDDAHGAAPNDDDGAGGDAHVDLTA